MIFIPYVVVLIILAGLLLSMVRVLREYERGVTFTLGRYTGVKGPGLIILIPFVQQLVRVDLRTIVLDVPTQDVISHDNVSVKVNAVVYFRVVDPDKAVINVENYLEATSQLAQTTLRSVLGKHDLDEMLAERDKLNADLQTILDSQTDAWGIKVANVEIKHVDIDESMVRAIARQAEAERNRRARIINAEGEHQAAERLVEAASMLAARPEAMQLRMLSTLFDISNDRTNTILFPLPVDLLKILTGSGVGKTVAPANPAGVAETSSAAPTEKPESAAAPGSTASAASTSNSATLGAGSHNAASPTPIVSDATFRQTGH